MTNHQTALDRAAKLGAARNREKQLVHNAIRDLKAYELALNYGEWPAMGVQFADAAEACGTLFGSDDVLQLAAEARGPDADDTDLFGLDPRGLQSRLASAQFDEARS